MKAYRPEDEERNGNDAMIVFLCAVGIAVVLFLVWAVGSWLTSVAN